MGVDGDQLRACGGMHWRVLSLDPLYAMTVDCNAVVRFKCTGRNTQHVVAGALPPIMAAGY